MGFWSKLGKAAGAVAGGFAGGLGPSAMPPAGAVPDGEAPNKYARALAAGVAGYNAAGQSQQQPQQQGSDDEYRSLSPATRALSDSQAAAAGGNVYQSAARQSSSMTPPQPAPAPMSYARAAVSGAQASGPGYAAIPGAAAGVIENYMRRQQDPGKMPQNLETAGQDPYQEALKRATMYQRG
jgi:hypothetical protein